MVIEQIIGSRITPEQDRAFLPEVIRIERAKITQLNMLNRIDSLDPDDAAMSEAWKRIATDGLHHTLPSETSDLVRYNIELIRKDMASTPRPNARLRSFKEQTGNNKLSELEKPKSWTCMCPQKQKRAPELIQLKLRCP